MVLIFSLSISNTNFNSFEIKKSVASVIYVLQTCYKHVVIFEYSQKTQLNQSTLHNLQPHLVCQHTKMFTLISHTICEILVNIKYLRHE